MGKRGGRVSAAMANRMQRRAYVMGLAAGGVSLRRISHRSGYHRTTVTRILSRYKGKSSYADRPRAGRPTKMTTATRRHVKRLLLEPTTGTARRAAARLKYQKHPISTASVRRMAKSMGVRPRVRKRKKELTADQMAKRVAFAVAHQHDSVKFRRSVVYLDEKLFICNVKTRHVWVDTTKDYDTTEPGTCARRLWSIALWWNDPDFGVIVTVKFGGLIAFRLFTVGACCVVFWREFDDTMKFRAKLRPGRTLAVRDCGD